METKSVSFSKDNTGRIGPKISSFITKLSKDLDQGFSAD
jgi:hypothetical protein